MLGEEQISMMKEISAGKKMLTPGVEILNQKSIQFKRDKIPDDAQRVVGNAIKSTLKL
jgi:hypothetical protein